MKKIIASILGWALALLGSFLVELGLSPEIVNPFLETALPVATAIILLILGELLPTKWINGLGGIVGDRIKKLLKIGD